MINFARIASLTMIMKKISLAIQNPRKHVGNEFQSEKKETGTDQLPIKVQPPHASQAEADGFQPLSVRQPNLFDNTPFRRMVAPVRVHSFDSALRAQGERIDSSIAFFDYQIIPRIWRL
ncbi:hypothetical protein OIU74_022417 [Salix koriyanagi]|uniref:Uncharacterized protein n=1 Tax=Salix koriyanagi TaxID=2511006 RepID=A0A9Q0WNB6_9ROSI|nr:hypothetical protein OIU74_022417 [Salix koriyanagi]